MPRFASIAACICTAVLVAGCADQQPTAPSFSPQFSLSSPVLSGQILGPDGNNVCNTLGTGVTYIVRVLRQTGSSLPVSTQQNLVCPNNTYLQMQPAPDTYYVRVTMGAGNRASMPVTHLDQPQLLFAGDASRNVQIQNGVPVNGGVFF